MQFSDKSRHRLERRGSRIIVDEARRRGIGVELVDAEEGYFALTLGGRSIVCRESLSEMTTAVAMSRCDDKRVTRRVLAAAGLSVPAQQAAGDEEEDRRFLAEHGSIVVKPARGEQGLGVAVNVCGHRPGRADPGGRRVRSHCLHEGLHGAF